MLFKYEVLGKANVELIDDDWVENYCAYEESVLLVLASSYDEAYKIANEKAIEREDRHENKYGQIVQIRFHDFIDCFLIGDEELENGLEVYSNIFDKSPDVSEKQVIEKHFPIEHKRREMLIIQKPFLG